MAKTKTKTSQVKVRVHLKSGAFVDTEGDARTLNEKIVKEGVGDGRTHYPPHEVAKIKTL